MFISHLIIYLYTFYTKTEKFSSGVHKKVTNLLQMPPAAENNVKPNGQSGFFFVQMVTT